MTVSDDDEKAAFLREIADEVRGEIGGEQVAAILYRVSDLYDSEEETSAQEIYLNVRYILEVKERGGLGR